MTVSRLTQVPQTRRRILTALKAEGATTIAILSDILNVSGEAVRQQLIQLQRDGWVRSSIERSGRSGKSGRPATRYSLTAAGEHLFPKRYDHMTLELMSAIENELGPAKLGRILGSLSEETVRFWTSRMRDRPMEDRLELLRSIYFEEDPYLELEKGDGEEGPRIIERNCPYLNVALQRPAICSVTIHSMSQLLGCRVVREKKFQNGDGQCAFRVLPNEKLDPDRQNFSLEEPAP